MANTIHSGGGEIHLANQDERDRDVADEQDRQPGRGVVGAIMAVRLAADRAVIDHFEVMVQQPAVAAARAAPARAAKIAVSIEARLGFAYGHRIALSPVYGRRGSIFPLVREFNCS